MIEAKVLCDSIDIRGHRITTWILTYPRFFHSEIKTHRIFSGNSASSRAIPVDKMIQGVIENTAMPEVWGKAAKGMQSKGELDNQERKIRWEEIVDPEKTDVDVIYLTELESAQRMWLEARDDAIKHARRLLSLGLHKQVVNRILEPYTHMVTLLTGTEFENFFALRANKDAQPEFQKLAFKMLDLYNDSAPKRLDGGEWHIPFGDRIDLDRLKRLIHYDDIKGHISLRNAELNRAIIKIAVARCARTSYINFDGKDDYANDIILHDRLLASRHASPAEHVAKAMTPTEYHYLTRGDVVDGNMILRDGWCRNFRGFIQYRCLLKNDTATDFRVKKYE